jgi:hypothetical protein
LSATGWAGHVQCPVRKVSHQDDAWGVPVSFPGV